MCVETVSISLAHGIMSFPNSICCPLLSSSGLMSNRQPSVSPLRLLLQELSKERKELILKLVSGLLDGGVAGDDSNLLPLGEPAPLLELEEPLESRLEERAVYNRLSLPQRDRKAPCKNFFWKTFTSC